MRTPKFVLPLTFGLALLVFGACGEGGGSTTGAGACYQANPEACTAFVGSAFTEDMLRQSCEYEVRPEGCPTQNLVGKCVMNQGGLNEVIIFYYSPGSPVETARQACDTAGGSFQEVQS